MGFPLIMYLILKLFLAVRVSRFTSFSMVIFFFSKMKIKKEKINQRRTDEYLNEIAGESFDLTGHRDP